MKEKVLNTCDGKKYTFQTYFIINNNKLFSTNNFNFEDNFKNCFYIKKFGSNTNPKIYLDTKINNKWVNKNQLLGDYYSLIDFISKNNTAFICIRGFSKASICQIVRMANELKGTNIKSVKFKNRILEVKYERNLAKKEQQLEELKEKRKNIENAEQYMKISNGIFRKERHKSRRKIIGLQRK